MVPYVSRYSVSICVYICCVFLARTCEVRLIRRHDTRFAVDQNACTSLQTLVSPVYVVILIVLVFHVFVVLYHRAEKWIMVCYQLIGEREIDER